MRGNSRHELKILIVCPLAKNEHTIKAAINEFLNMGFEF